MIGSWFPLPESTHGAWAWEVVAADGVTVASGTAHDENSAGWECRIALFVARTEVGAQAMDVALLKPPVRFGGRWSRSALAA